MRSRASARWGWCTGALLAAWGAACGSGEGGASSGVAPSSTDAGAGDDAVGASEAGGDGARALGHACGFADANPILFVTSVPIPENFATRVDAFGNHLGGVTAAARGGDLYVRYPDGRLRNLTREAGFGVPLPSGDEDPANTIAVRDPTPHASGKKALFSMVVGGYAAANEVKSFYWQIYEVEGFCPGEEVKITKLAQPPEYNHTYPLYGSDDAVLFVSDMPIQGPNGFRHLYPLKDEYESRAITSGIWRLDRSTGGVTILEHSPSGVFSPSVDSFGRVVFTRWDHLKRDMRGLKAGGNCGGLDDTSLTPIDFSSESAAATMACPGQLFDEVFPELQANVLQSYITAGAVVGDADFVGPTKTVETYRWGRSVGSAFNQFFPWMMKQDGTDEETLNHVGRHEIGGSYTPPSRIGDPALTDQTTAHALSPTTAAAITAQVGLQHMREDPTKPGRYWGVLTDEFNAKTSGQLVYLDAPPALNAAKMQIVFASHPDTRFPGTAGQPFKAGFDGLYRQPLPLSDGSLLVVHTPPAIRAAYAEPDATNANTANAASSYAFRLNRVAKGADGYLHPAGLVTSGVSKKVRYRLRDQIVRSYDGPLWELDPVEVRPSAPPPVTKGEVDPIEAAQLASLGVSVPSLQSWLRARDLAMIVVRNATQRDASDEQQPYNLRVPGGVQTVAPGCDPLAGCTVYDVDRLEILEARYVRGNAYGYDGQPSFSYPGGRRPLPRPLGELGPISAIDPAVTNPAAPAAPPGKKSLQVVAADGSVAAFVPARRALSWQLVHSGSPGEALKGSDAVVRERYWVTFQPGEIRTCPTCHGVNELAQDGKPASTKPGAALAALVQHYKDVLGGP